MGNDVVLNFHTRKNFERTKRLLAEHLEVSPDEVRDDAQSITFNKEELKGCDIADELEAFGIIDYDLE